MPDNVTSNMSPMPYLEKDIYRCKNNQKVKYLDKSIDYSGQYKISQFILMLILVLENSIENFRKHFNVAVFNLDNNYARENLYTYKLFSFLFN